MKKLIALCVALLSLLLISCSVQKDNINATANISINNSVNNSLNTTDIKDLIIRDLLKKLNQTSQAAAVIEENETKNVTPKQYENVALSMIDKKVEFDNAGFTPNVINAGMGQRIKISIHVGTQAYAGGYAIRGGSVNFGKIGRGSDGRQEFVTQFDSFNITAYNADTNVSTANLLIEVK